MNTIFVLPLLLAGLVVLVSAAGWLRWKSAVTGLGKKLEAFRRTGRVTAYAVHDLGPLPVPVQNYFRAALAEGQKPVTAVDLEQIGTINLSETTAQWKPFTAGQRVVTQRPGYVWSARIPRAGLPVLVQDAYVGGEGILRVLLGGLVTQANLRDRGELARGELMRYLAETPWYPTALLPDAGVTWCPVDEHSARATIHDGELSVTLLFRFGGDDLISTVRAEARGRMSGTTTVLRPWQCRLWNYALRDGLRVPLEGEAAWISPAGARPYWRGKITTVRYEFAP